MCPDFEWGEFLNIALQLKGEACPSPSPDCLNRTITNRAYYAAYHAALGYIREMDPLHFAGEKPTHGGVITWFRSHKDGDLQYIGRILSECYDERHPADYDSRQGNYSSSSARAIWFAERIRSRIDERRNSAHS